MKIWVYLNGVQNGPYTLEQVKLLPLEPSTPVWYDGLPKWIPASEAPMLADMFGDDAIAAAARQYAEAAQVHATAASISGAETLEPRPSSHIVWCILLTVLCCSPFGIAGLITGSMVGSRYDSGDYRGARRMSETTEWMVILGIVWGLIGWPVMAIFMF